MPPRWGSAFPCWRCVVIRGSAIPVAWHIVEATRKGAWRPHWEALFQTIQPAVPEDWTVLVPADRGLYAPWLYRLIAHHGWSAFLRITQQGQYRRKGQTTYQKRSQEVTRVGEQWIGEVTCFKTRSRQIDCTLVARWDAGYRAPWVIVTNVAPEQVDAAWYGMRAWIACGFKDTKRGGWHGEQTKTLCPRRAERMWLALAVATLWTVSVGCAVDAQTDGVPRALDDAEEMLADIRLAHGPRNPQRPRLLSCFQQGRLAILAAVVLGKPLPMGQLIPEPWPKSLDTHQEVDQAHSKAA